MRREAAPPSRVYVGVRVRLSANVGWADPGGVRGILPLRLDLANHSPDGFGWGYGGSGPCQLALALIADASGDDELALGSYLRFKDEIIAEIREEEWALGADAILAFASSLALASAIGR